MSLMNNLLIKVFLVFIFSNYLLACSSIGKIKEGDMFAAQGKWDQALESYNDAFQKAPNNYESRIKMVRAKHESAVLHLKQGEKFLKNKDYDRALLEFQLALALNPSLKRAQLYTIEVKKRKDADYYYKNGMDYIENNKPSEARVSLKKAISLNPRLDQAKAELKKLRESKTTVIKRFELDLKSDKPITLKFKSTPLKDIFNIISKLSGINFIFDEGVKKKRASIYLEDATFDQAMELLLMTNNLFKKVVNKNTIIIVADTKSKRQQYQDLLIHTFYLSNIEAKKAVNLLRTILQIKSIYVNEEINAIVVRDTPDRIAIAGKILKANDLADSEIMLDVEILEVARNNSQNLGLELNPDTLVMGLEDAARSGDQISYNTMKRFSKSNLLFTIPDVVINLQKQFGDVNLLANPKIRVANKEKAKIHIGDRVPIITVTTNQGVTTDNVQYVDVGVKLNVEPVIHLDNELSIKVSLEISSLGSSIKTSNGSIVYQIGTRSAETKLRLHDGETQIIGGLISEEERSTTVKIPFLGDIPILGRLFSSVDKSGKKTDILLSITPHIIRNKEVPDDEYKNIWSGKAQNISSKVPFESFEKEERGLGIHEPEKPYIVNPTNTSESNRQESIEHQEENSLNISSISDLSLSLVGPITVQTGDEFEISVEIANAIGITNAPFYLRYESQLIKFVKATEGTFMKKDGKTSSFMTFDDEKRGKLIVGNSRIGDTEGISGSGTIMTVLFRAVQKGETRLSLENVKISGRNSKVVPVNVFEKTVNIN